MTKHLGTQLKCLFFEAKKIWLSSKKFLVYYAWGVGLLGINKKSIINGTVLCIYISKYITYHSHNATYVWLAPAKSIV